MSAERSKFSFWVVVLGLGFVGFIGTARAGITTGQIQWTEWMAGEILVNPIETPVAGFTPKVVMGVTNATQNNQEYDAVRQSSMIGTAYPNSTNPYYTICTLDTGANVNLLSYTDRGGFGLPDTGYTIDLQGAGPDVVTADIMTPAGYFANGLQALTGPTTPPVTTGFVGASNIESVAAQSITQDLPTVLGTPFALFHTTVIRTDHNYTGTYNGQEYLSPQVEFYSSWKDSGVPRWDYRLVAHYDQAGLLPPVYVPEDYIILGIPPQPTATAAMFVDAGVADTGRNSGGSFLFDTGAQVTVISELVAMDLGLNLNAPEFTVEVTGIGGTQTVPGFTLDTLSLPAYGLGPFTLTNVPVIVLDVTGSTGAPVEGIIGMNLFTDRNLIINPSYSEGAAGPAWGTPFIGITALVGHPGDTNGDLMVNLADLSALAANYGAYGYASWAMGDFNHDAQVNLSDLSVMGAYYGQTWSGSEVPEPATLGCMVLAGLWGRRKRMV